MPVLLGLVAQIVQAQLMPSLDPLDAMNPCARSQEGTGYCIVYFDKRMKPIKTRNRACFFAYQLYDNGFPVFNMMRRSGRSTALETTEQARICADLMMLDGTYRLFRRNGRKLAEHVFDRGILRRSVVYGANGDELEGIDFDKPFRSEPHTAYFFIKNKQGRILRDGYWRKRDGRWDGYKVD
ncbi:MAG: hypothetical protein IPL52_11725 [Flavobacteriales bacterium]|nr:hypothetical protein [Flavobacteriales bacterium]